MILKPISCSNCGKTFTPSNHRIKNCSKKCGYESQRKSKRPDRQELIAMYKQLGSWGKVAKKIGVHRYTVARWTVGRYDIAKAEQILENIK